MLPYRGAQTLGEAIGERRHKESGGENLQAKTVIEEAIESPAMRRPSLCAKSTGLQWPINFFWNGWEGDK